MTLEDLTIENGYDTFGGGILNDGTLTLTDSTVSGNGNGNDAGGGIYNNGGTMTIADSTIANNTASYGGGIVNRGTMTVIASTISGNTCTSSGCGNGGIFSGGGYTATLGATIVAGNTGQLRRSRRCKPPKRRLQPDQRQDRQRLRLHRRDRPREQEPAPRTPRQERRPDEDPAAQPPPARPTT